MEAEAEVEAEVEAEAVLRLHLLLARLLEAEAVLRLHLLLARLLEAEAHELSVLLLARLLEAEVDAEAVLARALPLEVDVEPEAAVTDLVPHRESRRTCLPGVEARMLPGVFRSGGPTCTSSIRGYGYGPGGEGGAAPSANIRDPPGIGGKGVKGVNDRDPPPGVEARRLSFFYNENDVPRFLAQLLLCIDRLSHPSLLYR